jgi:hypothetical protein
MSKSVIRFLTLVVTTALVGTATVTPARPETSHGKHIKKHKFSVRGSRDVNARQATGRGWTVPRPPSGSGSVCPGMARSFDCAIWPPPYDDDPDRKASGSDGS